MKRELLRVNKYPPDEYLAMPAGGYEIALIGDVKLWAGSPHVRRHFTMAEKSLVK